VGLERGPLSLVSKTEELLGRKIGGSGLEIRAYGRRGSVTVTTCHPLPAEVGTNFADKQRPLGRYIRSRTQAMEFSFSLDISKQHTDAIFNLEDLAKQETTKYGRKYQRGLYLKP
jgi:hypothetical protein